MTRRLRSQLVPLLLAVMMLSACGGGSDGETRVASLSDDSSAAPTATASAADLEKELDDYVECLRKQGVDLPDPTVDADGNISFGLPAKGQSIDRDQLQAARDRCGDLPEGITSGFSKQNQSEMQDIALKFARCMREQGIDVPDPDLSKLGQGGGSPFGDLDRDDPKVSAGLEVCQKVWTEGGITLRGGGN
jgi:hypothetical protein